MKTYPTIDDAVHDTASLDQNADSVVEPSVAEGPGEIDSVLARYIQSVDGGEPLDREELLRTHPHLAGELREFFSNLDRFVKPMIDEGGGPHPSFPWKFAHFEILEEIGCGGMGVVYKARHTKLDCIYAVKMIRDAALADDEAVRRFRAEASATARLQHPHIVPIHEVGEHEGRHYFTMDYVASESLADRLREGPLPAPAGNQPPPRRRRRRTAPPTRRRPRRSSRPPPHQHPPPEPRIPVLPVPRRKTPFVCGDARL